MGATLLDIAPTLLTLMDLSVGRDMDGKVLVNALKNPGHLAPIPSWDEVEGESGMHAEGAELDAEIEAQALEQLIALGYVENPGEVAEQSIQKTVNENSFYLARSLMHTGQFDEAIDILEPLHEEYSEQFRYGLHLMHAYLELQRIGDARIVFDNIREVLEEKIDSASIFLLEGKLLLAENKIRKALASLRVCLGCVVKKDRKMEIDQIT